MNSLMPLTIAMLAVLAGIVIYAAGALEAMSWLQELLDRPIP